MILSNLPSNRKRSCSVKGMYLKSRIFQPGWLGPWMTFTPEVPNRPIPAAGRLKQDASNQLSGVGLALLPSQERSGRPLVMLVFDVSAPVKIGVYQPPVV